MMKSSSRKLMRMIQAACLALLTLVPAAFAQEAPKGARLEAVYVNGKWGYADQSGKVVIKPEFDAARPFEDGLARVGVVDEELPELEARPNIKWGYINEGGRVLVPLRYTVLSRFSENLAAAAVLDAEKPESLSLGRGSVANLKWGYVDGNGREVIPMQFLAAGDFAEGLAPVNAGGGGPGGELSLCGPEPKFGYVDKTGAFVIGPQFTRASRFQNGRARVSVGRVSYAGRCVCCGPRFVGTHGFVDRSGKFSPDEPKKGETLTEEEDLEY
jgi:hypothetical protein